MILNALVLLMQYTVKDMGYKFFKQRTKIWRVVANILNKQLQTANKGWSSSLGAGQGACYKMLHRTSDLDGFFEQPRQWKMDVRFGTLKVRSLYKAGSLKTAVSELAKCNLVLWQYKRQDGLRVVISQQTIIPSL
jgi:hypothetical protein